LNKQKRGIQNMLWIWVDSFLFFYSFDSGFFLKSYYSLDPEIV